MPTASMNDKKKWNRRLAPHIYDYNYKVGESYYTPQTDYIENRELLRSKQTPPETMNFAERFKERPIYGNTRGLPYDNSDSALSKPLVSRRAQSAGRNRSRDREIDDVPLASSSASRVGRSFGRAPSRDREIDDVSLASSSASRVGRSFGRALSRDRELEPSAVSAVLGLNRDRNRDRSLDRSLDHKVTFNPDDYLTKFSVDDELNYQVAPKRYSSSARKIASEADFDINPKIKKEMTDELERIRTEFRKANSVERGPVPRTTQYEDTVYNSDIGATGKRRVKREEVNYTMPPTGSKVRKSTYTESNKFESTKPPRAPKPSRLCSIEDDLDFKLPTTSRLRKFSLSGIDDEEFKLKYQIPLPRSRKRTVEEENQFQQNLSLREQRRNQESEQLSSNISNLVNKMKSHDLEDGYKFTRTIRASSLDPFEREPRVKARTQARVHQFTYGVSK